MTNDDSGADPLPSPRPAPNVIISSCWIDLYKEVCANIRESDDISFKLLGLIPALAGSAAGALVFLETSDFGGSTSSSAVLALSVIGFGITFGVVRWELRNIQKCVWLITRAKDLEQFALARGGDPPTTIQYVGYEDAKRPHAEWGSVWEWGSAWGKTEAEVWIYIFALLAWSVPAAVALVSLLRAAS